MEYDAEEQRKERALHQGLVNMKRNLSGVAAGEPRRVATVHRVLNQRNASLCSARTSTTDAVASDARLPGSIPYFAAGGGSVPMPY